MIPGLLEAFEVANRMFINMGVRPSKADHSSSPPLHQTHKHKVEYDLNLIQKANSERTSRGLERTTLDYKTEALSTRPCRLSGFLQVLSGLANAFNWNPAETNQEQLISPSSLQNSCSKTSWLCNYCISYGALSSDQALYSFDYWGK